MSTALTALGFDDTWKDRIQTGGILGKESGRLLNQASTGIGVFGTAKIVDRINSAVAQIGVAVEYNSLRQRKSINATEKTVAIRSNMANLIREYRRTTDRLVVYEASVLGDVYDSEQKRLLVNSWTLLDAFHRADQASNAMPAIAAMLAILEECLGLNPSRGERVLKISRPTYYKWRLDKDAQPHPNKLQRLQTLHRLFVREPNFAVKSLLDLPNDAGQSLMQLLEADSLQERTIELHIGWLKSLTTEQRLERFSAGSKMLANSIRQTKPFAKETISTVTQSGGIRRQGQQHE